MSIFNILFSTFFREIAAALIERVGVGSRRKLDNLDFGGLRARVSTRGDSLRNFCDRSFCRARGTPRTLFRYACMHACMHVCITHVCVHAHMPMYVHAYNTHPGVYTHIHTRIYVSWRRIGSCYRAARYRHCRNDKSVRARSETCKDALYKVPPRRHHSVSPVPCSFPQPPAPSRNETFKYSRTSFPTVALYTRFTCARFSARRRQPFPSILPGI